MNYGARGILDVNPVSCHFVNDFCYERISISFTLSTVQFVARWFTPSICFKNFKCSLSIGFLHCFSDRKSHGENFIVNRGTPYFTIIRADRKYYLIKKSINILILPDKNFLVLPRRLYITLLALLLSSLIFILKFPVFEIMDLRYVYELQKSMVLSANFFVGTILDFLFCTIMALVFLLLTVILFFSQYFCSLFKHCCKPFFVSDIRTRSSAQRRWLRESFKMLNGWHWSLSKMSPISLIKRLKSIGLKLHPYFSPVLDVKKCVVALGRHILSLLFVYISSKSDITLTKK